MIKSDICIYRLKNTRHRQPAANNIITDYEQSGSEQLNLQLGDWSDFAQACAGLRNIYSDKTVQEYEDNLWEARDKLVSQLRDPSILPNY